MTDRTEELARVIELAENESRSPSHLARAILASPVIAEIEREVVASKIFMYLGAMRDGMPPEDVAIIQRFADAILAGEHRSGT